MKPQSDLWLYLKQNSNYLHIKKTSDILSDSNYNFPVPKYKCSVQDYYAKQRNMASPQIG